MDYSKLAFFEYNEKRKFIEGIIKILLLILIISIILGYFLDFFSGTFIDKAFNFLKSQFSGKSAASPFFIGLIGGLFFLSVPLEILFMNSILSLNINPWIIATIFFLGISISYPLDYFMGRMFSRFATKLVSPKQFYKIKVKLNKYGKGIVFLFNVFPLPSQILTFVCGVFKYNKIRYFSVWFFAWIIKISVIILFYPVIDNFISMVSTIF